jgi:hypothetical protein
MNKRLIKFINENKYHFSFIFNIFTGIDEKRYNEIMAGSSLATIEELVSIAAFFYVDVETIRDV